MHRKLSGGNYPKVRIVFISGVGVWKLQLSSLYVRKSIFYTELVLFFIIRKRVYFMTYLSCFFALPLTTSLTNLRIFPSSPWSLLKLFFPESQTSPTYLI